MLSFLFMMLFMVPMVFFVIIDWYSLYFFYGFCFFIYGGFDSYSMNVSYLLGSDLLTFGMVILSFWIGSLMLMASESLYGKSFLFSLIYFSCFVYGFFLFLTFTSMNLIMFYLFFEASLVPIFLIVMGWGYQPERFQASIYLLFYTLFASLPMMLGIFYIYLCEGTLSFSLMFSEFSSFYLYFCMIVAFLVKMPMFMVHLWLPKAHVEAPISGSMILAGVLLKLGGYGLIRLLFMFSSLSKLFSSFLISLSMVGACLVSLLCLRQVDMKILIAYSSVVHMGLVLGGIMTLSVWGMSGSFMMMIAHGLCSSGLFCLANISYERVGSRSLMMNKGMMNIMPSMTLWWFLLSSSNMAAPPSLNLMGEISLLTCILSWSGYTMVALMLVSFFSAAYSLFLFSFSQHGSLYSGCFSCSSGYVREYVLLFLHWVPLNLLIMKGEMFFLWI
uniref:NADH-ubiquinone oxidoreductase chain 4 n=1 Tax=Noteridae sp. MJTNT-2012 TaxID=1227477 RepID=S4SW04_9COLE|nr:NADH dehydrogenase subunit 4 [Noteridae sp. MJTNT-2012]